MVTGRFAPTPSGRMHIGNIYAMLAAWLSSRAQGGRMLLRIEDIDTPRVLPDADRWIMDDLTWLGLDWDGDPVYQSQRHEHYEQALAILRAMPAEPSAPSHAARLPLIYPCFCSRADIRAASAPQEGDRFIIYPGTCRRAWSEQPETVRARLAAGDQHSLRIAMPTPASSRAVCRFTDRVYGPQTFNLACDLGDTVLRRADGLFAYQLVVTVDDLLQGVDDVVRGRDLLRSTALQLYIRDRLVDGGFGGETDKTDCLELAFAHLPLIDNAAGRRLAKRERSLDMGALRKRGIQPEQVIGYCAWLLGLIDQPEPCMPVDLLDRFSWERVAANTADRRIPDDPFV
ncbi:glutamyl-Q tRNA(Asp) ligase [Bifidobacterium goeldii]|uniref:Glutamyl-Q tRNA(Asp) ligase n=2 Tax=Bifidobacterium goeldii TaxID=2306975 RepID=A0A430FDT8_9BIFI|nr:glutamyl-Q tRNA(Asp) ligase [Bifidobacterium goeldii]